MTMTRPDYDEDTPSDDEDDASPEENTSLLQNGRRPGQRNPFGQQNR